MPAHERYKTKQVIKAIRKAHGVLTDAARELGCDRVTVWRYVQRHPTVRAAYDEQREMLLDKAENNLIAALEKKYWPATLFVLTTLGKDRGYSGRQSVEVSGPKGGAIKHEVTSAKVMIYVPDNSRGPAAEIETDDEESWDEEGQG